MEQSIERYPVDSPFINEGGDIVPFDTVLPGLTPMYDSFKTHIAVWNGFCANIRREYCCKLVEKIERTEGQYTRLENRFMFPCGKIQSFVIWIDSNRSTNSMGRIGVRDSGIAENISNHFSFETLCFYDLTKNSVETVVQAALRLFYQRRGKTLAASNKKGVSKPMTAEVQATSRVRTGHVPKTVVSSSGDFQVLGSTLINIEGEPQHWKNAVNHRNNFYFKPGDDAPGVSFYRKKNGVWAARKRQKVGDKFVVTVIPAVDVEYLQTLAGLRTINLCLDMKFRAHNQSVADDHSSQVEPVPLDADSGRQPTNDTDTGKQIIEGQTVLDAGNSVVEHATNAAQVMENVIQQVTGSQERLNKVLHQAIIAGERLQKLNDGVTRKFQEIVEFMDSFSFTGEEEHSKKTQSELRAEVKQILADFSSSSPFRFFVKDMNHHMYSYVYEIYGRQPYMQNPRKDPRYKRYDPERKKTIRALDIIEDSEGMEVLLDIVRGAFVDDRGIDFLHWAIDCGHTVSTSESAKAALQRAGVTVL